MKELAFKLFGIAQARFPRQMGAIMRKVTSTIPKLSRKKKKAFPTAGIEAANKAARVKVHPPRDPQRTNGVLAANKAAGIPGAQ